MNATVIGAIMFVHLVVIVLDYTGICTHWGPTSDSLEAIMMKLHQMLLTGQLFNH